MAKLLNLTSPISADNPVGSSIRYLPIYDQLRQAMKQDDEDLSQGVWETTLKKADWEKVEEIAGDILANHAKDLQVAAWLMEARFHHGGLPALSEGLTLLQKLSESYWDSIHPFDAEDPDHEARLQIFEWVRSLLLRLLYQYPIANHNQERKASYSDYMIAHQLDDAVKQAKNGTKLLDKAKKRNEMTLDEVKSAIARTSTETANETTDHLHELLASTKSLDKTLEGFWGANSLSFAKVYDCVDSILHLTKPQLIKKPKAKKASVSAPLPKEEQPHPIELSREEAYRKLSEAAETLSQLEPHSPTPQILRKLITWEAKNLSEIFSDIASDPQELVTLMRFLGISDKKNDTPPLQNPS